MALEKISENVWTLSRENNAPGAGNIGARMTLLRLKNGDIMMISPVRMNQADAKEISSLGRVAWIIAPNCLHHLFIKNAQELFPLSKLMGPEFLSERRKDLKFDQFITESAWAWRSEIDLVRVAARKPMTEEYLFYHKQDRVLVVTDFAFNIQHVKGLMPTLFHKFNNTYKRLGMSRIGRMSFNNRQNLKTVIEKIQQWNPLQLVVAHGEIVKTNASQQLVDSFNWL